MSDDYFAVWLWIVALVSFGIGIWVGKFPDTTEDEQADEELAKLERDVELMRLKIEQQELQRRLKI